MLKCRIVTERSLFFHDKNVQTFFGTFVAILLLLWIPTKVRMLAHPLG
jgi:hypothetical protein